MHAWKENLYLQMNFLYEIMNPSGKKNCLLLRIILFMQKSLHLIYSYINIEKPTFD